MRGVIGRQAFEHNPSPVYGRRWRQRAFLGTPVFRRATAPDEGKPHLSQTLIRPRVPRVHLLPRAGEGLVLARRPFGSPVSRPGASRALRAISRRNAGAMRRPRGQSPAGSATIAAKRTGRFIAPNREVKTPKTHRNRTQIRLRHNWLELACGPESDVKRAWLGAFDFEGLISGRAARLGGDLRRRIRKDPGGSPSRWFRDRVLYQRVVHVYRIG